MNEEQAWDGVDRRSPERWHVGKEVPIAVLFTLVVQTGGGIWWLAQLSAKIDSAISTLAEFRIERYTREDARRDLELVMAVIEQQRQRDQDLERRMALVEAAHERMRK